jgi:tetratricopeptide (TPR) repeat protein
LALSDALRRAGKLEPAKTFADAAIARAERGTATDRLAAHESAARVALALRDTGGPPRTRPCRPKWIPPAACRRFVRGRLLFDQGKFEEAVVAFSEGEPPASDDAPAPAPVAELELYEGESLVHLDRAEDAEAAFRSEISAFPRDPRAYLSLATLYQSTKPEEVESVLDDLIEAVPTPEVYGLVATALTNAGNRSVPTPSAPMPGSSFAATRRWRVLDTRCAPISASPTPAQNRFRTLRMTARVTPCAEASASTGDSAPENASSTPTRNGTNLNAIVMARFSARR